MFSLTHLIILRNLQEKTNFVSLPQSANSFWKSIKWPACLGRKQHRLPISQLSYEDGMQEDGSQDVNAEDTEPSPDQDG